jgi:hypothetical protein
MAVTAPAMNAFIIMFNGLTVFSSLLLTG